MNGKIMFRIILTVLLCLTFQAKADPFNIEKQIQKTPTSCNFPINVELTLPDVLNLALCRNPATQQAYMGALAAAADVGVATSTYLPTIGLNGSINQSETKNKPSDVKTDSSAVSAGLSLGWLIYDFGGRKAALTYSQENLNSVLYTRSDTLQSLIFNTAEAYFLLFAAQEEYKNSLETESAALAAYDAASKRYELGMAALSDKLQAETSYAESQLTVTKAREAELLAHSRLAVLMNLNPDSKLNLAAPTQSIDISMLPDEFENLVETGLMKRADILAQESAIKQAKANIEIQKAQNGPTINLSASAGDNGELSGKNNQNISGNIGLSVSIPIFTGFSNTYKISQAEYKLEQSIAKLNVLKNTLKSELWTTFQNYHTSKKSYEITLTMYASAEQNASVALGAYKAGRGSILNVLDAQSKLASVRTTKSRSFYALLIAKANLIRKIGLINPFNAEKGFLNQ